MKNKRKGGVDSRKSEDGEELMVPYARLSEKQKDQDRQTVTTVLEAIKSVNGDAMKKPGIDLPIALKKPSAMKGGPGEAMPKPAMPKPPMADEPDGDEPDYDVAACVKRIEKNLAKITAALGIEAEPDESEETDEGDGE